MQQHYEYNVLNQLASVENQQQKTSYQYDALGRRISKRNSQSETKFLWLDNTLLSETTRLANGEINTAKIYLYEPGTHKPLAIVQDSEIYHYHLDHLGTPQEITNSRGKLAWSASFKAYGNLAVVHNNEIENNLRFQGQYYDEETGLHYNRFRYYDPECGRFISQDPIGLLGGVNNYQYVPNPTGWVDPLGLSCKETIPDNYDFLDDRYENPINQEKINHNTARDIEDLLDAEGRKFKLLDPQITKNCRAIYQSCDMKNVIEYHEFLAIRAYTDDFYKGINPAMRSGDLGKWDPLVSSAESGLKKLAQSEDFSVAGTMTRGADFSDAEIEKLFPDNGVFSDKAFMSSSYDSGKAFTEKNVKFTIETSNPQAKIGGVSVYGDTEAEVLFNRGSKFDVVSKEKLPDGKWNIHLKEKS